MDKPIDKTPVMFPQFIQIAFHPTSGALYALDEAGDIYRRNPSSDTWVRQAGRGDNDKS